MPLYDQAKAKSQDGKSCYLNEIAAVVLRDSVLQSSNAFGVQERCLRAKGRKIARRACHRF
jgi:hypothetical protein